MHISLIGHTGFFGKEIYNFLKNKKNIKSISVISSKNIDLSDKKNISRLSKIYKKNSIIIFCAGIKKQYGDNLEIFNKNQSIVLNFAQSLNSNVKKIIYFSSASVYGEDIDTKEKINEKTELQLKSYYGISKFVSEKILEKKSLEHEIDLVIFRIPLVYGIGDTTIGYGPSDFVHKFLNKKEINLWGNGEELREFIYIEDIVKITNIFLTKNIHGVFNIVSGKSYSYRDVIRILEKKLNIKCRINRNKRTKKKVNHSYDNLKLKNNLEKYKFLNLEEGLSKFLKSYEQKQKK